MQLKNSRILIVDDQPVNVDLLRKLLTKFGYANLESTSDPREVRRLYDTYRPDLILLDLTMPHMDGFQVLEALDAAGAGQRRDYLPVLVLTADITSQAKEKALSLGAKDFLTKPFDHTEVLLRIKNLLETRHLHVALRQHNETLEEKVKDRTREIWDALRRLEGAQKNLRLSHEETIGRLSIAAEFRDDETAKHIHRMSLYCSLLARAIGWDHEQAELLRVASQMHDVGKIGIPDAILLKRGPLTPGERSTMEEHAQIGYSILSGSKSELLELAATIALTHHERIDGAGYPRRIDGDAIPIEGRIASICDVYDALSSDRVYRKAFPFIKAIEMMRDGRGTQFDPELLDVFFDSMDGVLAIKEAHENEESSELTSRALRHA